MASAGTELLNRHDGSSNRELRLKRQALSNLRVIDLTHYIAGPYCTKLLAGFGAEVIKVERPQAGDKLRALGPFCDHRESPEASIPFHWLNTGKKSVTLNLKCEAGTEILKQLVREAAVLVENFSPRVMPSLGLDYETLRQINPRLIMTSISNFGQAGPYRDYRAEEIEIEALSGMMHLTGRPERPPLGAGPAVCQYSGGLHAYTGTLIALFQGKRSRRGQHVDVSLMECGVENIEIVMANHLQHWREARRGPNVMVPWDLYECQDGYAAIVAMPQRHWHRARDIFGDPRVFEEKYTHLFGRMAHRQEYEELLQPCIKAMPKKALFDEGQSRSLAFGYLASLSEALESPQHEARGFFEEIDHPAVGRHRHCGAPFKMSRTPWRTGRAPLLGEHNREVYGQLLGYSTQDIRDMTNRGTI